MGVSDKESVDNSSIIDWTTEMEVQLFYAMKGHKPVGVNRFFQMALVHQRFNNSINKEIPSSLLWDHLSTMYDLDALNESEIVPFPNKDVEFSLPIPEYGDLITKKSFEKEKPSKSLDKENKEKTSKGNEKEKAKSDKISKTNEKEKSKSGDKDKNSKTDKEKSNKNNSFSSGENKASSQKSIGSTKVIANISNSETPENSPRRKGRPSKNKSSDDGKPGSPVNVGGKRKRQ